MPVTSIISNSDFEEKIRSNGDGLVVVDFTAEWCGPCKAIGPVFESLSNIYADVIFLRLDVDLLQFFKRGVVIDQLVGSDPRSLETKLKKWKNPGNFDNSGNDVSSSSVPGYSNLFEFIDVNQMTCLNQTKESKLLSTLSPKGGGFVESDLDAEILLSIPFRQPIKLHSINFICKDLDRAPKDVKLYIDKTSPGFEDLRTMSCTQELHFSRDELQKGLPICLRFVRFQRVHSLHIFVESNLSDEDSTRIDQIILVGQTLTATDMKEFKRIAGHAGESDH